MAADLRIPLVIASLCLIWIFGSASLSSRGLLGVAPQDEGYYQSNVIKCKDGSKKFTREQLNDDFCDCPDGTDEPGTSACPEGKFYCKNAGHAPHTIFSSRVNDGICDCCDGSDEYDGKVRCANTCWEAGKVAREKLKKKIATYQDGVVIRKQEVENAKLAFAKDEGQLLKLKSEEKILKGLVQKLKEHKERIEKAEEEERLKKEKEEKKLREAERKVAEQEKPLEESPGDNTKEGHDKLPESHDQDAREGGQDTVEAQINSNDETKHVAEDHDETTVKSRSDDDVRSDTASDSHAANQHPEEDEDDTMLEIGGDDDDGTTNEATFNEHSAEQEHSSDDTSGLTKEELGRLVASRWGEDVAQKAGKADNNNMNEEEHEDNQDIQDSAQEDDNHGYSSENEDGHKYEDDEFGNGSDEEYEEDLVEPNDSYNPDEDDKTDSSEFTTSTSPSWLEKVQQSVQNILQSFNFFRTPVDISEAARVRKEYEDSSSKLSKIQSRISSLNEKLKHDFGKEKEFYSFYDNCFESKQNKYVYKVCPFKKASQVEGHSTTQLGSWDKFDESYKVMQFSKGDKCWNGPDRSMKVRLRCGLKNELADVDEPSRCEYFALLSTPALCLEDKLKELQQKLELTNTNQPVSRDEL